MPQRRSLLRRLFAPAIRRRAQAFARDERGATAIEFALLALPFFTLIFAILETSIVFLAGQILDSAVQDASRKIRTGQAQKPATTSTSFRDRDLRRPLRACSTATQAADRERRVASATFDAATIVEPIVPTARRRAIRRRVRLDARRGLRRRRRLEHRPRAGLLQMADDPQPAAASTSRRRRAARACSRRCASSATSRSERDATAHLGCVAASASRATSAGVAAVEFALILPFLLVLFVGSIEASSLITVDRRVNVISGTVGDLVARIGRRRSATTDARPTTSRPPKSIIYPYPAAASSSVVTLREGRRRRHARKVAVELRLQRRRRRKTDDVAYPLPPTAR